MRLQRLLPLAILLTLTGVGPLECGRWRFFGGNPENTHFSAREFRISTHNVDELEVKCAGEDCDEGDIRANEWVGSGGPCSGDSGGPALDAEGRVIGVVSRGKDPCVEPVFGDVATRATWLRAEALRLANAADQEPPAWTPCDAPDPCTYDDPPESDAEELESSCATVKGARSGWPTGLLALGLGLVLGVRVRRRRPN